MAVDVVTGRRLWAQPGSILTIHPEEQPSTLAPGVVFMTGWPQNNEVRAIDERSGEVIWTAEMPSEPSLFFSDDALYVRSYGSGISRLDPATGAELWFSDLTGDGVEVSGVDPSGTRILVTSPGERRENSQRTGDWIVLDAAHGSLVVTGELGAAAGSGVLPLWFGERILITTQDEWGGTTIEALDVDFGATAWTIDGVGNPRVVGDEMFVFSQQVVEVDGSAVDLHRLERADDSGRIAWSWEPDDELQPYGLDVTDGIVTVGLIDDGFGDGPVRGGVVALDLASGTELWRLPTALPVVTDPITTPGGLLVLAQDLSIFCD